MSLPSHVSARRWLFLSPDVTQPTGGVQILYEQAAFLRDAGVEAFVVHQQPGFRCSWFSHAARVPVLAAPAVVANPARDVVVIPEIWAAAVGAVAPGTPKVLFNMNAANTFSGWTPFSPPPYQHADVVGVVVLSGHDAQRVRAAFPKPPIHVLRTLVDTERFQPGARGPLTVAGMPRKHPAAFAEVAHGLARAGWGPDRVRWHVLDSVSQDVVAAALATTDVFLAFGGPEGLGLPPLEALASGALIVGDPGGGGRAFFRPPWGWPVSVQHPRRFVQAASRLLQDLARDRAMYDDVRRAARLWVVRHYGIEAARRSSAQVWTAVAESAALRTEAARPT